MNALTSRVSAPLAVCLVGAAIAGFSLLRSPTPAAQPPTTAAPATTVAADPPADDGSPSEDAPVDDTPALIDIAGFAFSGAQTVAPGQTITVTNADGAPHTLTSTDGLFDTGLIDGGGEGSLVAPTTPGTYAYFCALHPSMTGTITVG